MSTLSKILKAPLQLLVVSALVASYYVAFNHIQNMGWAGPIIMTILAILYGVGVVIERRSQNEQQTI